MTLHQDGPKQSRKVQPKDRIGETPKRERFGWKTVDKPGEFALIDKNQLQVDDSYQRKHKHQKVLKLAQAWSWAACGTIIVALREDAEWFVVDGQHRVLGAKLRDDIKLLPCMVFDMDSLPEEARAFINANTNRKAMTMVDRFRALIKADDHKALVISELVASAGRVVQSGSNARSFTAVDALNRCLQEDEQTMRRVWPLINEVCGTNNKITQSLIMGVWYLEKRLRPGESLVTTRWRERLLQVGHDAIMQSIEATAIFLGGSRGRRTCALGVAQAINKGGDKQKTLRHPLVHTLRMEEEQDD